MWENIQTLFVDQNKYLLIKHYHYAMLSWIEHSAYETKVTEYHKALSADFTAYPAVRTLIFL